MKSILKYPIFYGSVKEGYFPRSWVENILREVCCIVTAYDFSRTAKTMFPRVGGERNLCSLTQRLCRALDK